MDETILVGSEQLKALLAERVKTHQVDLTSRYFGVLRESLFSSRAELRPSMLKQIAADEAEVLLCFLRGERRGSAEERGGQLHATGFNAGAILRLSQVSRLFLLNHLDDHQIAPMLDIVHEYQEAVILGFVKGLENNMLMEVERTRRAVQRGDI